jgi:hypothetical protein
MSPFGEYREQTFVTVVSGIVGSSASAGSGLGGVVGHVTRVGAANGMPGVAAGLIGLVVFRSHPGRYDEGREPATAPEGPDRSAP